MSLPYKAIMTSDKQDWETPQELFDNLNKEFDFELDAFATDKNAKPKRTWMAKDKRYLDLSRMRDRSKERWVDK